MQMPRGSQIAWLFAASLLLFMLTALMGLVEGEVRGPSPVLTATYYLSIGTFWLGVGLVVVKAIQAARQDRDRER